MAELIAMDVVINSVYDWSTAAGEAANMARRLSDGGHECVGYDLDQGNAAAMTRDGKAVLVANHLPNARTDEIYVTQLEVAVA